jgi:DNA-binding transcriptional MerR regulator
MKSGELARLAGVTVETLRFYERKGLLRKPARTNSGYRAYTNRDLEQVRFIRDCQALGFTLADVGPLMQRHGLTDGNASLSNTCPGDRILGIVRDRLAAIDSKLEALKRMRDYLATALTESEARSQPVCPAQNLKKEKTS